MGYRHDYQEQRFEEPLKVSFDFDNTLSRPEIQTLCKTMPVKKYIVTSRSKKTVNDDLYEVADAMKIPRNRIVFTEHEFKADFLKGIHFHFDDDPVEIEMIMSANNGCIPIFLPLKTRETYQLP